MVRAGEVVTVTVLFVAEYACWGRTARGEVGMIPFEGDEADDLPAVGRQLSVVVERVLDPVGQEQHSDTTYDGRIRRVDFVASVTGPPRT